MTAHARFLALAAATPAFGLADDEARELGAHLRACRECASSAAAYRSDLLAIGRADPAVSPRLHDRIREVAVTAPRTGPGALGILAIMVLLAVAVVGASFGVGAFLAARPASTPEPLADRSGDTVRWHTDVVDLAASRLTIDANGLEFRPVANAVVSSDPGNLEYWTLEVTWQEQGRQQRLSLYFAADAATWWISEIRVYDGADRQAEWARFPPGPYARTALGATFEGDLDLRGTSASGPVGLRIEGLRIAVRPDDHITAPLGGGIVLPENGDPFGPAGALRCSGILQRSPVEAEARLLAMGYRLSWRWEYATGPNTGYAEVRERAPATGWISGTAVGMSGELVVFVADPARPMGAGPVELPADCAAPAP
jgi:hypothetical protein